MKKIFIFMLIVPIVCFSACQTTPDKPVVVQKDMQQMIDKAKTTLAPDIEKLPLTERYEVKKHLSKTINKLDGKLVIDVNADVGVPASDTLPIVRAIPANFSQETVYALFKALCGNTVMYKGRNSKNGYLYSKTEVNDILVLLKQKISGLEASGKDKDELASLKDEVRYFEGAYDSAPGSVEDTPSDGTLKEQDVYYGKSLAGVTTAVSAVEYPGKYYNGYQGKHFSVYNNSDQNGTVEYDGAKGKKQTIYPAYQAKLEYFDERYYDEIGYWNRSKWKRVFKENSISQEEIKKAGISPEEASASADKLFTSAQIPFSVTSIYYVDAPQPCYMLECSRQVGGTNLTTAGEGMGGDGLSPFWGYEKTSLFVSKEGIIFFRWYSPYEVRKTKVKSATLMPFEGIENIFYNMMETIYAPAAKQENGTKINVYYVSLQLQRIKLSEDNSDGLLTPVWCFYGTRSVNEKIKNDDMESDWAAMGYSPLLIVNAVDGSIIDVSKGY